ncbi:S-formylglutathione hydrolase [Kangiella koreensis]|uniref:S-formylglutathione hydrolase n=1 Tax=Kangiella koreensis (strain DSM 16069 / JCM 12317 / KCTC 12182 / SW-125) TaxID=523791 RepID=C7R701_KANKD|nr:S-formylglutathione hydrolase [Kangiella koreensis]ACV27457.1 S-formylglutathione hydrolase [Kangiella koreensis DSM 16069]
MSINEISANKSFSGWHKQFTHTSSALNCEMRFAVYLPPQMEQGKKVPVLYWLSGLTCTDENFMQKAGAHRMAAELGMMIVAPDTSPRGDDVADDEGYDLGKGAGFYVNATQEPWAKHYQMYDYITHELPQIIEGNFSVTEQKAIAGHSMGGHGALMIALRNPQMFVSASAFSPIVNPMNCPWGEKAFTAYLGDDKEVWKEYDTCYLMENYLMEQTDQKIPMLVSQGEADQFLAEQLKPEALQAVASKKSYPLILEYHQGYDHSYYFIASFIEQHLKFHAEHLV